MTPDASAGPSYPRVIAEALARFGSREAFIEGGQRLSYAGCAEIVSQFQ